MSLQWLDARGRSIALPADLGYDPADPYAVSVTFGTRDEAVTWLVGRDLLLDGLTDPVGEGDVLLWPSIDDHGRASVVLELCCPNGRMIAQLSTRELSSFLSRTLLVVPQGAELLDVDELVASLTSEPE